MELITSDGRKTAVVGNPSDVVPICDGNAFVNVFAVSPKGPTTIAVMIEGIFAVVKNESRKATVITPPSARLAIAIRISFFFSFIIFHSPNGAGLDPPAQLFRAVGVQGRGYVLASQSFALLAGSLERRFRVVSNLFA